MTVEAETERARRIWEKMAGAYDRGIALPERLLFSGGREWACSQAGGEVLEIAVGTGRNLAFYTPGVRLTGIDFSPAMLEIAGSRANDLDIRVSLRAADAQDLPFPNASFDTVVCTLALCSIPDDRRAVSEAARVLRPGGLLLLLEHVRSPLPRVSAVQRFLNRVTVRFQADHLTHEPLEHLEAEGFEIERLERRKLGIVERVRARKPMA
ncbi:MAG: class I SAM-dependent methyltransferase [Candidatus Dormibacteraeota bacterium]|nr:class I SAM-dependent methyltransferase [Candidatus Dormibacteraeota bacterium]